MEADVLPRVVAAREALGVGDVAHADAVLEDLEHDLAVNTPRPHRTFRCLGCGTTFTWPGELQAHLDRTGHGFEETA